MATGPTFAPGYVRPGTYPEVIFETRPNVSPPPFITVLIGRTNLDKLKVDPVIRNGVAAQTISIDPTTGVITVTAGDVDETIRRDILVADNSDITIISGVKQVLSITDNENFLTFNKGYDQDWVTADSGIKTYIEWITDYNVKAVAAAPIFAGKAGAASFIVQIARASGDPLFTTAPAVTALDGAHIVGGGLRLNKAAAVYTLELDGGTPVVITAGGQFTITSGVSGDIEVLVDAVALVATFGALGDADYDNNVTIVTRGPRIGVGADPNNLVTLGARYETTYRTKKELTDFVPATFDSIADTQEFHGTVSNTSRNDDLGLGCVPYFNQGGQTVYVVPLKDKLILGATDGFDLDEPTGSGYVSAVEAALAQLEDVKVVSMIIPLSPTEVISAGNFRPGILASVLSHVNRMSTVGKAGPRMAILGARAGTTNEDVFTAAAGTAVSNRIIYLAPATATLVTGGVTKVVDGSNIAAAIAGILSSGVNAGEPISGKPITVFSDIPESFTEVVKDRMAGVFGVAIVEKENGQSIVRHFLTTQSTTTLRSEGKVTVIEIDVRRSLKNALDATVINQRLVSDQTIGMVKAFIGFVLTQKKSVEIINNFNIIKVEVDPDEARQINVELSVEPVLDANWIKIEALFQAGGA